MANSIIDNILAEAAAEVELEKKANDEQGAPETAKNTSGNGQSDIVTTANSLLQKLEEFKASLGQQVAEAGGGEQPPVDGQAQPGVDENGQPVAASGGAGGGATIQTPGGTIIKLASLIKLASCYGKTLFEEVK